MKKKIRNIVCKIIDGLIIREITITLKNLKTMNLVIKLALMNYLYIHSLFKVIYV